MRTGRILVGLMVALAALFTLTGCQDALSDGLLLGISGGVNTGLSSLIAGVFAAVAGSVFGVTPTAGGGPPF